MKTIKKFNELFDNEDLYSKSEIRYLTGEVLDDVKNMIQNDEILDFKDIPELAKVIKQLHMNYPFLQHSTGMAQHKDKEGIAFVFTDGEEVDNGFIFSIEVKGEDKFDLAHGIIEDGEEYSKLEKDIDFETLNNLVGSTVYPNLKKAVANFKEDGVEILLPGEEMSNFSPMFNSVVYNFEEYVNETNK